MLYLEFRVFRSKGKGSFTQILTIAHWFDIFQQRKAQTNLKKFKNVCQNYSATTLLKYMTIYL